MDSRKQGLSFPNIFKVLNLTISLLNVYLIIPNDITSLLDTHVAGGRRESKERKKFKVFIKILYKPKPWKQSKLTILFLIFYSYFIYLFIYFWLCWVFGSCEGFLQLRQAGATLHRGVGTALHRGARAPHYCGPSRCGAQAPDAQAQ